MSSRKHDIRCRVGILMIKAKRSSIKVLRACEWGGGRGLSRTEARARVGARDDGYLVHEELPRKMGDRLKAIVDKELRGHDNEAAAICTRAGTPLSKLTSWHARSSGKASSPEAAHRRGRRATQSAMSTNLYGNRCISCSQSSRQRAELRVARRI